MNGNIEGNSLVGNLTDNSLIGTISNEGSITGDIHPVTIKTVRSYNQLTNKPQINSVELQGDKSLEELNVTRLTNSEIEDIINSIIV